MRNIIAITQKEMRSYFSSPIAYISVGFFALLFGWFYINELLDFVRQSTQNQFGGAQPVNINQTMIPRVLQNVTILILFIMPMVTMRTYSEEKRSGTIELLLTSPLTDFQIIMGKFLGALGLWATMLLVSLIHMGLLFVYGNPEWKPILSAYLGLLLLGGAFISVGLFISSLTKNQIVAGMVTFAVFLLLWVLPWIGIFFPAVYSPTQYLSIIYHYEDFGKGVLDMTHFVYYVSFITFGLFLTAKSVDSERWRA